MSDGRGQEGMSAGGRGGGWTWTEDGVANIIQISERVEVHFIII